MERPTQRAHREVAAILREGDLAIDATAGNGHDTLFLAQQVGSTGRVIAFDIQEEAIRSTRARLKAAGVAETVTLIHRSHAAIATRVEPGSASAVMFNLGYLPGGDHTVITQEKETLDGLRQSLVALRNDGGLLCIVCYPGHPGGLEESEAVTKWATGLDNSHYRTEIISRPGHEDHVSGPFLVLVRKG